MCSIAHTPPPTPGCLVFCVIFFAGLHGNDCNIRPQLAPLLEEATRGANADQKRCLLVIVTPDLFSDKRCLEEIYTAQRANMPVYRIMFDCGRHLEVLPLAKQWVMGVEDPFKEKLWYNSAAHWFHDKPSEPKCPHTVYTSGVELNSIGLALKRATAQKSTAVDASKVRNHYQLIMFD